ncbi:MAG: hypothetical protein DRP45_07145 [Candidatus Zixiibacteriota bacterium]|nr:MAG: hypothetical protein DRP45_07145 [candidate division Zixibacteria bacterium]
MANVILKSGLLAVLSLLMVTPSTWASDSIDERVDSLFVIASSGEVKYREMVEPAKLAIAEMGAEVVPRLIEKFTTKSARERHTIVNILKEIGSPAVPDLLRALKGDNGLVVQRVCWALGDIKDSSAVDGLVEVSDHPRWQVRDQAIGALGKIGDTRGADVVHFALTDTIGQVRKAAAVSAGKLAMGQSVEQLVHILGDDFYGARLSALHALLQLNKRRVFVVLSDSLESENHRLGNLGCRVLGRLATGDALDLLLTQSRSPNPSRRAQAAVALVKADPFDNCGFREKFLADETDRFVQLKVESAISAQQDAE